MHFSVMGKRHVFGIQQVVSYCVRAWDLISDVEIQSIDV